MWTSQGCAGWANSLLHNTSTAVCMLAHTHVCVTKRAEVSGLQHHSPFNIILDGLQTKPITLPVCV